MKLAPSILSFDFTKFDEQLKILNDNVEYLHFDVMDGKFVPNTTFTPEVLKRFRSKSNLIMDVHLMVVNPKDYIDRFVDAGADIITFHLESLNYDLEKCFELIDYIHIKNIKAGISVKPNTDIKLIEPLLDKLDLVLIMSVEPGFGGQKFINTCLDKVKYLKEIKMTKKSNYVIEIDGGINDQNISIVKNAGAELIVSGSFIFKGDILSNINKLK